MKKYLIKILSCIMSGILFIAALATLTIANDSESCAQIISDESIQFSFILNNRNDIISSDIYSISDIINTLDITE